MNNILLFDKLSSKLTDLYGILWREIGGVEVFTGKATTTLRHFGFVRFNMNIHKLMVSIRIFSQWKGVLTAVWADVLWMNFLSIGNDYGYI